MTTNNDFLPGAGPEAYGRWLATQTWTPSRGGEIINANEVALLVSGPVRSTGPTITKAEHEHVMHLIQQTPQMLRAMLEALAVFDNGALNISNQVAQVQALLQGVVDAALPEVGEPLYVARAIRESQQEPDWLDSVK